MDVPPRQPSDSARSDEAAGSESLQRHLAEGIYALSLARSREEVYRVLLDRASEALPSGHWFLGQIEEREGPRSVDLVAATPLAKVRLGTAIQGPGLSLFDSGLVQEICTHLRSGWIADARTSPDMVPPVLVETTGLRSLLGLPLAFEGRLSGLLFAAAFQDEAAFLPGEEGLAVLQSLARIGALALERLQAEARLAETALLFRDLAKAVRDLAEATDEDALVARLFQWAVRLGPLTEWWFNRYDPSTRTCRTTHWTPGLEAYGSVEGIRRPDPVDGDPILERVHLQQKAVLIPRWEDLPTSPGRFGWPGPLHTWVGLPLAHEGSVAGSLSGGSYGDQGHVVISEEQFEALQSLAETAGLVLNRLYARKALEAQETRFRLLFEQSPDATALLAQGLIMDVNKATVALLGYPRQALLGVDPTRLSPARQPTGASSREAALALLAEVKSGLRNRFEWTFLHASGHEIPCDVAITQYLLGSQHIYHAVFRDLTDQKRVGAEHAALERQLFQAQKMESLGVLAGGIAHDFNNLLMGVLGHAGLALEQLNPLHPARRNLESIQKAGQRAADLTRQMLAYSGRGRFEVRNLDLSAQVEEMLHLLEVSLPKTVVLNLGLKKGLPAVSADASQIQQVIMNLVINAAEAIGEASGSITIATGAQNVTEAAAQTMLVGQDVAPGIYVYLEVADTGCGMDSDTLNRIFEPFFTTKFTGRGLGLSAIMGIVRGHKGALRVYSEMGHGTTFKVLLPALSAGAEAAAVPMEEPSWAGTGIVLVVDDDETVRAVARQTLEMKGFQVLEAQDGIEAVDLVRTQGAAIGVVILDMTMPRMGGEEAFREMRLLHPEIRVILSSGYNEVEAMSRFMGKGLKGFIQKPYGPRELLAKIQDSLQS
ncbi:response regulator [Geothrix fuzhouensis]|uniref:response regulator n=1 Tax=Geothrix fuzhouensis TaxID=2966451 RepID=UPI002147B634|nr:response regulator [Geothrix fuzhouensis]